MGRSIDDLDSEAIAAILTRSALTGDMSDTGLVYRRANRAFKAIDRARDPVLNELVAEGGPLDRLLDTCAPSSIKVEPDPPLIKFRAPVRRTLPLTVLFSEGPIGRAYLSAMFAAGLQPEK